MRKHKWLYVLPNLHLFDGDGGGAGAGDGGAEGNAGEAGAPAAGSAKNPLANVVYGKQENTQHDDGKKPEPETQVTSDTKEARKAEFERLIKGEYKDLFDERAQQIIDARFKQTKALEAEANRSKALAPVLELLASKYGVDGKDVDALVKAIEEDDSYYEDEAIQKGLTVEQLKKQKALERENAEFKRAREEQERRQNADRIYAQWQQQADDTKRFYPNFDFNAEVTSAETSSRFLDLLRAGVDVRTAYEVIHKDDLLAGAMQYTAQTIQQKTVNDIRARGMRPAENGTAGNNSAVTVKTDPTKFTKKDREEISRRVMLGERIVL